MHVTIIAKEPIAGRVKTRLCPPCTPQQAADVAAAALADTFDSIAAATSGMDVRRVLLLDGARPDSTPDSTEVVAQRGSGLSERLRNGFEELGPGLIVGMETPAAARSVGAAVPWLRDGVHVLGLATDGGYWCIGVAQTDCSVLDAVFGDVPMSRSNTGLTQLRALHRVGATRLLAMARDLDTPDDLRAHLREPHGGLLRIAAARALGVQ